jgi:flagellin
MIINHNLSAVNAHRNLMINSFNNDKNLEALSSGERINRARDDAAGLAVSEKMRSQIRGLHQAGRNAQDAISFVQTAEGHLQETTAALQRIRELSIQAANGIYTPSDRMQIQVEVSQLVSEIERISQQADFNTWRPLNGTFSKEGNLAAVDTTGAGDPNAIAAAGSQTMDGLVVHIGANMDQNTRIHIGDMSARALKLAEAAQEPTPPKMSISVSTEKDANLTISVIDDALTTVNKQRADLGAYQNRLEMAVKGIDVAAENLQAAESRIRDTDMANQMVDFVRNSILTQSATSMLAQANIRPQLVLRVLG